MNRKRLLDTAEFTGICGKDTVPDDMIFFVNLCITSFAGQIRHGTLQDIQIIPLPIGMKAT